MSVAGVPLRMVAQCVGKVRYLHRPEAERVAESMKSNPKVKKRHRPLLGAYRCQFCPYWHVGKSTTRSEA